MFAALAHAYYNNRYMAREVRKAICNMIDANPKQIQDITAVMFVLNNQGERDGNMRGYAYGTHIELTVFMHLYKCVIHVISFAPPAVDAAADAGKKLR